MDYFKCLFYSISCLLERIIFNKLLKFEVCFCLVFNTLLFKSELLLIHIKAKIRGIKLILHQNLFQSELKPTTSNLEMLTVLEVLDLRPQLAASIGTTNKVIKHIKRVGLRQSKRRRFQLRLCFTNINGNAYCSCGNCALGNRF